MTQRRLADVSNLPFTGKFATLSTDIGVVCPRRASQGCCPDPATAGENAGFPGCGTGCVVPCWRIATYLLCHGHTARECPVAFAAWKGFDSPLRGGSALASCATGDHRVWWTVEATDSRTALTYLPPYVAARTEVVLVRGVTIP